MLQAITPVNICLTCVILGESGPGMCRSEVKDLAVVAVSVEQLLCCVPQGFAEQMPQTGIA